VKPREKILKFLKSGERPSLDIVNHVVGSDFWSFFSGSVYPILRAMEREGLLETRLEASAPGEARYPRARVYYRLKAGT
jgi:DNA-binding PadR family transcriptional regulator